MKKNIFRKWRSEKKERFPTFHDRGVDITIAIFWLLLFVVAFIIWLVVI